MRRSRGNVGLISPRGEKDRAGVAAFAEKIDGWLGEINFIDPCVVDAQSEKEHKEREGGEGEPCALWRVRSHEWRAALQRLALTGRREWRGTIDGSAR